MFWAVFSRTIGKLSNFFSSFTMLKCWLACFVILSMFAAAQCGKKAQAVVVVSNQGGGKCGNAKTIVKTGGGGK